MPIRTIIAEAPIVVHAAQESAERRLLGDEPEALVGVAGRRDVGGGERDPGDDLHDEGEERRAAEDVHPPPAARFRHRVASSPRRRASRSPSGRQTPAMLA